METRSQLYKKSKKLGWNKKWNKSTKNDMKKFINEASSKYFLTPDEINITKGLCPLENKTINFLSKNYPNTFNNLVKNKIIDMLLLSKDDIKERFYVKHDLRAIVKSHFTGEESLYLSFSRNYYWKKGGGYKDFLQEQKEDIEDMCCPYECMDELLEERKRTNELLEERKRTNELIPDKYYYEGEDFSCYKKDNVDFSYYENEKMVKF